METAGGAVEQRGCLGQRPSETGALPQAPLHLAIEIGRNVGFSRHLHHFHLPLRQNSSTNRRGRDDRDFEGRGPRLAPFLHLFVNDRSLRSLHAYKFVGAGERQGSGLVEK